MDIVPIMVVACILGLLLESFVIVAHGSQLHRGNKARRRVAMLLGVLYRTACIAGIAFLYPCVRSADCPAVLSGKFLWGVLGVLVLARFLNPLLSIILFPLRQYLFKANSRSRHDTYLFI